MQLGRDIPQDQIGKSIEILNTKLDNICETCSWVAACGGYDGSVKCKIQNPTPRIAMFVRSSFLPTRKNPASEIHASWIHASWIHASWVHASGIHV